MIDIENKENNDHRQAFENFALLAGGLAHDYNNMLTAMLGNIDLVLCEDISDSVRDTVKDIKSLILKSSQLVRRMLSCASLSEPQNEQIDLNIVIGDLIRIMRKTIPDNVTVSIEPPVRLPMVCADATMLWQVLMNLVINSCNAIDGKVGFVKIAARHKTLTSEELISYSRDEDLSQGDYVELSVTDNGCGIPDEVKGHIFDPFFTTRKNGNGLGLPSVFSIVKLYHGGISIETEAGRGTTFRVILPAYHAEGGALVFSDGDQGRLTELPQSCVCKGPDVPKEDESLPNQIPIASEIKVPVSGCQCKFKAAKEGKKTILVVDDEISILKLLKIILNKTELYNVIAASSGEEGLEAYHKDAGTIDMCLVDASMGAGMNGLDLCAAIRAENDSIPLVLMSAYRAKEMSARMAASGVTAFLPKPFRGTDVLELCAKSLG